MAVLLEIRDAWKRFGDQVLLDGASVTITDGGKVGFIGRNGAGKSTLLRAILGEEELDSGEIIRHPRLRLGYLRQHDPFQPNETAIGFLMRDSGQPDWKCGEIAGRFELKGPMLVGPVHELSGGWQTRVKLAALLLHEPNLLLLDEPTNFLDLRTQLLLEHFLRDYRESCLVVSHDRGFLTATCERTLDLSGGKLSLFPGKIEAFLAHQRQQREHVERTNAAVLAKRRQLEDFIARNKARASTASRAKSKSKQLERLELEETAADSPTAAIRCPIVAPRQGPAVRCRGLAIGYPGQPVARAIDLEIEHGARAAIVGDNGQGKTTFLRTLVGSLHPLAGDVKWGYGCALGIYAQHVYSALDLRDTVLSYLERAAAIGTKSQQILDVAGAMLFRGRAVEKSVSVLSGGERARLCLAGLLLGGHNVLVLDEPGNHLDVETVDALARALVEYRGTVVFTSHDRSFVGAVATVVIEVAAGRVTVSGGSYAEYLARVTEEVDAAEQPDVRHRPPALGKKTGATGREAQSPGKPGGREDRELRREIGGLERTISRLDAEKRAAQQALLTATDPDEAMRLHVALTTAVERLAAAEERWLELQSRSDGAG